MPIFKCINTNILLNFNSQNPPNLLLHPDYQNQTPIMVATASLARGSSSMRIPTKTRSIYHPGNQNPLESH